MTHHILADNPQFAVFAKRRRQATQAFDKAVADQQSRVAVYTEACNRAATDGTAFPPAPESEQSIRSRSAVTSNQIDQEETDWLVAHAADLVAECYAREDELIADAAGQLGAFDALLAELRSLATTLQNLSFKAGTARPDVTTALDVTDVIRAARSGGRVLRPSPPAASTVAPAPQSMFKRPLFQRSAV